MADDVSVSLTARDNYSPTMARIAENARKTARDMATLENQLSRINRTRATLKVDMEQARRDLQTAQKEYNATAKAAKDTTDAAQKLSDAQLRYDNLKDELASLANQSNFTKAAIRDLYKEIRTGGSVNSGKIDGILSQPLTTGAQEYGLAALASMHGVQQLAQQWGAMLSQGADYVAGSALGDRAANYASSTLSGAVSGASAGMMIGSAIAPGVGTAVGAVGGALLGAASGALTAAIQNAETEDDYFRQAVQDLFSAVTEEIATSLSEGAATAASRETIGVSYATLLGGQENANALLGEIEEFANATPYTYDELAGVGRIIASYGYGQDAIMTVLQAAGEASSAVGGGSAGMQTIATVLGRIKSGKLGAEELEMLTNIGINAYDLIGKHMYRAEAEEYTKYFNYNSEEERQAAIQRRMENFNPYDQQWIREAITNGWFSDGEGDFKTTEDFAAALIEELLTVYQGSLEAQSKTTEGLQSTLGGLTDSLNASMGKGYNTERNLGLQAEIDYLKGNETELEEIYSLMGEYQAQQENAKEALARDVRTSLLAGEITGTARNMSEENQRLLEDLIAQMDEAKAAGDGGAVTTVWQSALAMAEAEYTNTDEYKEQVNQQLQLVDNLQKEVAPTWYDAGRKLADRMSQGVVAALKENQERVKAAEEELAYASIQAQIDTGLVEWGGAAQNPVDAELAGDKDTTVQALYEYYHPHAAGLTRVPYNNYAALLHEGERVLTAREARNYREGSTSPIYVNVTGNTIQSPADEDRLAAKIANMLRQALLLAPA